MSYVPRIQLFAVAALLLWGCSSLKEAEGGGTSAPDAATLDDGGGSVDPASGDGGVGPTTTGNDAGPATSADAGPAVDPATVGAGPLGALPSGYCCASNDACRNRHCEVANGTKMCLDFCLGDDDCAGVSTGFHCALTASGYGFCEPAASVTTCTPAAQFQHGSKPLGTCCQPLGDGRTGSECLSGVCDRNGAQNPWLCTADCGKNACPGTFTCGHADDFGLRYECLPVKSDYSCTP